MPKENFKILLVDDNPGMRESFKDILQERYEKASVAVASDGFEAVKMVMGGHFDILFIDICMPGISGVEAFKEIKKISPGSSVILMTGYSVDELIMEAAKEGVFSIIYKPFDAEKIFEEIEEALKT